MAIQVAFGLHKLDGRKKSAPTRFLLLRDGDLRWAGIDLELTKESAGEIIAKFNDQGVNLPIDHDHSTLMVEQGKVAQAPAAGWIKGLEYVPGKGLFATDIEWTEEAAGQIENRQYQYLSPVILFDDETGLIHKLHSAALTNRPRTKDQIPLLEAAARLEIEVSKEIGIMATTQTVPKKKEGEPIAAQEPEGGPAVDPTQKLLAGLVGALQAKGVQVADEAPLNDVLRAAIDAIGEGAIEEAPTEEATASEKPAGAAAPAVPAELRLKAAAFDDMNTRVKAIEAVQKESATDVAVEAQIAAGKILPEATEVIAAAREYHETNPEGFKKFYAAMAPICEPGSVILDQKATGPGGERGRLIAAASREFDDNPKYTKHSTRERWVNTSLREDGLSELSEAETKKLEA